MDDDIWLMDSGATSHFTNSLDGMSELNDCRIRVQIGDRKKLMAIKEGNLKVNVEQPNGENKIVTLSNVKYVPEMWCKLFS